MADEPEIEVVVADEEIDEAYLRREHPEAYENTPADDLAELRLCSVMDLLSKQGYPEFGSIPLTRPGVASHTIAAADEARRDVLSALRVEDGSSLLCDSAMAYLMTPMQVGKYSSPKQVMRAERWRKYLVEADEGHFTRDRFATLWRELQVNKW